MCVIHNLCMCVPVMHGHVVCMHAMCVSSTHTCDVYDRVCVCAVCACIVCVGVRVQCVCPCVCAVYACSVCMCCVCVVCVCAVCVSACVRRIAGQKELTDDIPCLHQG